MIAGKRGPNKRTNTIKRVKAPIDVRREAALTAMQKLVEGDMAGCKESLHRYFIITGHHERIAEKACKLPKNVLRLVTPYANPTFSNLASLIQHISDIENIHYVVNIQKPEKAHGHYCR